MRTSKFECRNPKIMAKGEEMVLFQTLELGASRLFRVSNFVLRALGFLLGMSTLACWIPAAFAAEIKTPLVVWDVNFNEETLDAPPHRISKEQLEKFNTKGDLSWVPLREKLKLHIVIAKRLKNNHAQL